MTSGTGESRGAPTQGPPWASVALLVALGLAAGAMLLPWWSVGATGAGTATFEFGLTGLCVRPSGACGSYGSLAASVPAYAAVGGVFSVALDLAAIALVAALLAFVLSLLRRGPQAAAGISGLASGASMLVATLDVFASLPGAVSSLPYASAVSGFSGSISAGGTTVTWGGGPGWILGLAASAVLLLLGLGTLVRERRKKA